MGELLGSPSGRLFVYDPAANKSRVLKDKIHFANGVALSPNEDYLIYAETAAFRLMKFWLSGPQEGSFTNRIIFPLLLFTQTYYIILLTVRFRRGSG